jgi:hypothetical protein
MDLTIVEADIAVVSASVVVVSTVARLTHVPDVERSK